MKKEDLKVSFDKIKADQFAKKRMLDNILNHSVRREYKTMKLFNYKKVIPVMALLIVIAGGLFTYRMLSGNPDYNMPEYNVTDDMAREDAVAPLLNQFKIDDKHYILLSDDLRQEYGLPDTVNQDHIGEKIADITEGPDKSFIGSEVYRYIPAGCEAIVAVKKDNEYLLFKFFTFESYNNNQDEDAVRYLALYGINSADDISKVRFIGHSEQSKLQGIPDIRGEITDRDEIARFFSYYSALKNSSDKYFDKLFNFSDTNSGNSNKGIEIDPAVPVTPPDPVEPDMTAPDQIGDRKDLPMDRPSGRTDIAEDLPLRINYNNTDAAFTNSDTPAGNDTPVSYRPSHGMMDMGGEPGAVAPSQGSSGQALSNSVTIRIYNKSGIYYDSEYYINMGFISRYEISKDFAGFISKYLNE